MRKNEVINKAINEGINEVINEGKMSIKAIRICVKDSVKMRFECVECKIGRNGRWGIKGVINEGINDENYSMKCSG